MFTARNLRWIWLASGLMQLLLAYSFGRRLLSMDDAVEGVSAKLGELQTMLAPLRNDPAVGKIVEKSFEVSSALYAFPDDVGRMLLLVVASSFVAGLLLSNAISGDNEKAAS